MTRLCPPSHAAVPVMPPRGQGAGLSDEWPLQTFLELGAFPSAVPCARLHARHMLWEWDSPISLNRSSCSFPSY